MLILQYLFLKLSENNIRNHFFTEGFVELLDNQLFAVAQLFSQDRRSE